MAARNVTFTGGAKLQRTLAAMAERLGSGKQVRVGFLEKSRYPAGAKKPGLHVATVAFWNEFGTSRAPARPFFRDMIAAKSSKWAAAMAKIAKANEYDADKTLALMGEGIKGQLQGAINQGHDPPNAPETVRRKGFNHPLIDTAVMLRAVDFTVEEAP